MDQCLLLVLTETNLTEKKVCEGFIYFEYCDRVGVVAYIHLIDVAIVADIAAVKVVFPWST